MTALDSYRRGVRSYVSELRRMGADGDAKYLAAACAAPVEPTTVQWILDNAEHNLASTQVPKARRRGFIYLRAARSIARLQRAAA